MKQDMLPKRIYAESFYVSFQLHHLFYDATDHLDELDKACQDCFEGGNLLYAGFIKFFYTTTLYTAGSNLNKLDEELNSYIKLLKITNDIETDNFISLYRPHLRHLLMEQGVSLENLLDLMKKKLSFPGIYIINMIGKVAISCFLEEKYIQAKYFAEEYNRKQYPPIMIGYPEQCLYYILILSSLYSSSSKKERKQYNEIIYELTKHIKNYALQNKNNFLHLYLIAQAELANISHNEVKAIDLFDQGIAAANAHGFIQWVAIANERAASLYLRLNKDKLAIPYILDAIYYYGQWGCNLKVNALKKKYHALLSPYHISIEKISKKESGTIFGEELDLASILKASQVISGEIILDKLLENILHVVIENAGADKAVFIGFYNQTWNIEASGRVVEGKLLLETIEKPLKPGEDVPESLISYVIRTGESITINNLLKEDKYIKDEYFKRLKPKSVLCLPVQRYNRVLAVLYLENNLTTNAFTADRIHVLKTLSSQIAISTENAHLFHTSERFVPKKFIQLLHKESIEDVNVGDSVKIDMTALFGDLRDFTTIAEKLTPKQLAMLLNTYMKYMAPIIRKNNGFVVQFLGDGILAMFPGKAIDAVQAALDMHAAFPKFNLEINQMRFPSVQLGVAIHSGPAMLCILGEEERMEASIVSDVVNSASRIEGLNKLYSTRFLISDATYNLLPEKRNFIIQFIDQVRVKGKTKALGIYQILPADPSRDISLHSKYLQTFEMAYNEYKSGNFTEAKKSFETCLSIKENDSVAKLFISRCESFLKDGTPENWDGIMTILEK